MRVAELYRAVTERIIADLERGTAPWVRPWKATGVGLDYLPYNVATGRSYRGVNVLVLWQMAEQRGYPLPRWLTYRQAKGLGGHVRKGERGTTVVFLKPVERDRDSAESDEENGDTGRTRSLVLRGYTVFNVAQVAGLAEHFYQLAGLVPEGERCARANAFMEAIPATIRHGGDQACYLPGTDTVQLPAFAAFVRPESYYATAFHELGHWTGHESRLARDLSGRFGERSYAAEELVAELTAAFVCAQLGLEGKEPHADYIQPWLELLKADNRAILTASSKASDAADYLASFSEADELDGQRASEEGAA